MEFIQGSHVTPSNRRLNRRLYMITEFCEEHMNNLVNAIVYPEVTIRSKL